MAGAGGPPAFVSVLQGHDDAVGVGGEPGRRKPPAGPAGCRRRPQPFDQAIDVACLAWHGWDNVRAAVDGETFHRARVWWRTFGIEQIVAAIANGEPDDVVERYVRSATRRLDAQIA